MKKKAILLINVGTTDSPELSDVKKYLSEFLNDKRVITLPYIVRKILVNCIIVPFRSKKSSVLYNKLWTKNGSPLLIYSQSLVTKLNKEFKENSKAFVGMRYGNPSVKSALEEIEKYKPDELIVLPLYPQYAVSTTESAFDAVKNVIKNWENPPETIFIKQFYNHPDFINVFSKKVLDYSPLEYDHIIFSYHGLPNSHIEKAHSKIKMEDCNCKKEMPAHGTFCYRATCFETTRLLVKELDIPKDQYSVGFQSRLTKNWISPFTDKIIQNLAKKGLKNILVVAPSFVTDCLETVIEIEQEYRELFIQYGGKKLTLVKSLNDDDAWVGTIVKFTTKMIF